MLVFQENSVRKSKRGHGLKGLSMKYFVRVSGCYVIQAMPVPFHTELRIYVWIEGYCLDKFTLTAQCQCWLIALQNSSQRFIYAWIPGGDGGTPWTLVNDDKNVRLCTLKRIEVWVSSDECITLIRITLSDDIPHLKGLTYTESVLHEFQFEVGEVVTCMTCWGNAQQPEKMGGLEFTTSMGRAFEVSVSTLRGEARTVDVGCGVVVGVHGRYD